MLDDERAARHGRVTVLSPRLDRDEVVGVRDGWEDESGRLNLAVLPEWEKQMPDSARRCTDVPAGDDRFGGREDPGLA